MARDAEILVHIDAPGRVADDAAYRALAEAYLSFEPAVQPSGCSPPSSSRPLPNSSFTSLRATDSQELSFDGALDNRSSPRLPTVPSRQHHATPSPRAPDQWTPPSHISDSYPMPAAAIYASPTRILQRFTRGEDTSPISQASLDPDDEVAIPSSIPDPGHDESPPAPRLPGQRKRPLRALDPIDDSTHDMTHVSASDPSVHALPEDPLPAPSPKRAKTLPAGDHATAQRPDSAGAMRLAFPSSPGPAVAATLEARPPSPPVGDAAIAPDDLVSPKLARLASQLWTRYRPETTSPAGGRAVDPLERGYWLVDCRTWDDAGRRQAWAFLAGYVAAGQAGWGVWCRRAEGPGHDWIRLYCWGALAGHTYLLLYLASSRRLKTTGAEWRDAGGDVVLRVRPQSRRADGGEAYI